MINVRWLSGQTEPRVFAGESTVVETQFLTLRLGLSFAIGAFYLLPILPSKQHHGEPFVFHSASIIFLLGHTFRGNDHENVRLLAFVIMQQG
jgi:hypothetical protein